MEILRADNLVLMNSDTFETIGKGGNSVSPGDDKYTFVFGEGISIPVTLFSTTLTECGDGNCESNLDEGPESCCIDCECPGEDSQCTTSGSYQYGYCHVCGDGTPDPVENYTNCCVDLDVGSCPEGTYCNDTMNLPFGQCVDPNCGKFGCEPNEDSINCAFDCHDTAGKTCEDMYDPTYYYDDDKEACVKAVCGNEDCEAPIENYDNCCLDCNTCPDTADGKSRYCNTTIAENGICLVSGCGERGCEVGETPANCCIDCGCSDYGSGFECEQNSCHDCGNDEIEFPETNQTCCEDTGCDLGYCSINQTCQDTGDLLLSAIIMPAGGLDCQQTGDASTIEHMMIVMSIPRRPLNFESFDKASYTFDGVTKDIPTGNCDTEGHAYVCVVPVVASHPEDENVFIGCFRGEGESEGPISFTVDFTYRIEGEHPTLQVTNTTTVKIANGVGRDCNELNGCEPGQGENQNICCYDCGCTDSVCVNNQGTNMCADKSTISLTATGNAEEDAESINCVRGTESTEDYVTFSAEVNTIPHTWQNWFRFNDDYTLTYDNKMYIPGHNLTGFECTPQVEGADSKHTGVLDCRVPITSFPPCPWASPAQLTLNISIDGGGIVEKMLGDTFDIHYLQGLPNCGDGPNKCDAGETNDNCCQDCNCASGDLFCPLENTECQPVSELYINMTVPAELNCSDPGGKSLNFTAEIIPKPYHGFEFPNRQTDTILNGSFIYDDCRMAGENNYVLDCKVPLTELTYCFELGDYNLPFVTDILYDNGTDIVEFNLSSHVDFTVTETMERGCDGTLMDCDPETGEMPDQCCSDCGCRGDNFCTYDKDNDNGVCIAEAPSLEITEIPDEIPCDPNLRYSILAEINNMPYWVEDSETKWRGIVGGEKYVLGACEPEPDARNVFNCTLTTNVLPICKQDGERDVTLMVNITYNDAVTGIPHEIELEDDTTLQTEGWMEYTSEHGVIDTSHGENSTTCCQDVGCYDVSPNHICVKHASGFSECVNTDTIEFKITEPEPITNPSMKSAINYEKVGDSYEINNFKYDFTEPLEFDTEIVNLPYNARVSQEYIYFTVDDSEKRHNLHFTNDDHTAMELGRAYIETEDSDIGGEHELTVGIMIVVPAPDDDEVHQRSFERNDTARLRYDIENTGYLTSMENYKNRLEGKTMGTFKYIVSAMLMYTGMCIGCLKISEDELKETPDPIPAGAPGGPLPAAAVAKGLVSLVPLLGFGIAHFGFGVAQNSMTKLFALSIATGLAIGSIMKFYNICEAGIAKTLCGSSAVTVAAILITGLSVTTMLGWQKYTQNKFEEAFEMSEMEVGDDIEQFYFPYD
jgi:hypothetical protein